MEHSFINWTNLTKFWLEEHDTRVFGFKNNQKVIEELRRQRESALKYDRKQAFLLASQLSIQEEHYCLSKLLIETFNTAWDELNNKEQCLLETIHRRGLSRSDAYTELTEKLFCSESTARRHYNKALKRFQILLLG